MARKNETQAPETAQTETEAQTSVLTYGDKTIDANELSPKALMYLLQYGLNKSRQDSVAGMAKAMAGETNEDGSRKHTDEDIAAAIAKAQDERLTAILEGTLGVRKSAGPKATPFESLVRKVAVERIRAAAAAKGKDFKLPKGEDFDKLVEGFTAKYREDIEAEAKRRQEANAGVSEDLLGDLV